MGKIEELFRPWRGGVATAIVAGLGTLAGLSGAGCASDVGTGDGTGQGDGLAGQGGGAPAASEPVCTPGARRCSADGARVERCGDDGLAWCAVQNCLDAPARGLCVDADCVAVCDVASKSNMGCEYFAVDLDNAAVPCDRGPTGEWIFCDAAASQFAVVVSNPDTSQIAHVVVTRAPSDWAPAASGCVAADEVSDQAWVDAARVPPQGLHVFELPRRDVNGTVQGRLAYRLASNVPLTAYQFNPLANVGVFSNDASMLLPTSVLGSEYRVMTREQTFEDLKGFIAVVGVREEPTLVQVKVTAPTAPGEGLPVRWPGQTVTTTLQQYEVLNVASNQVGSDFTGSVVNANGPVAVFGGSEAANAPNSTGCDLATGTCVGDVSVSCGCADDAPATCSPHAPCAIPRLITCCADHLEQQLVPTSAWGTDYAAARSYPRGLEKDVWRVLASEAGTVVTLDPPEVANVPVLAAGEWFEFATDVDFLLQASKPVALGQFLAAQDAPRPGQQPGDARIGDPAFMLAVPMRQMRSGYVFLVPDAYAEDYVSVAFRTGADVALDGVPLDRYPDVIRGRMGASEAWQAVRMRVSDGVHELVCAGGCGVMVHGYDQYVSYGYPGGMNVLSQ